MVSPEGEQFNGARFALAELVRRGFGEEDLENLRSSMMGWRRSEHLPPGWMYKHEKKDYKNRNNCTMIHFLAPNGDLLDFYISAIKLMETSDLYSEEDIQGMKNLSKEATGLLRKVKKDKEHSSTLVLPEGWKSWSQAKPSSMLYLQRETSITVQG